MDRRIAASLHGIFRPAPGIPDRRRGDRRRASRAGGVDRLTRNLGASTVAHAANAGWSRPSRSTRALRVRHDRPVNGAGARWIS
jgi:hypothetical protein